MSINYKTGENINQNGDSSSEKIEISSIEPPELPSPYFDETIGTEREGEHEIQENQKDPYSIEETEKRAKILASHAINLFSTQIEQQELDRRYQLTVDLLIGIVRELGSNDRIINMIRNMHTVDLAKSLLNERNRLAYIILSFVELTNTIVDNVTFIDLDKKIVTSHLPKLTIENIADTSLVAEHMMYAHNNYIYMRDNYKNMSERYTKIQRNMENLNNRISDSVRLLHEVEEKRDSYSRVAGDVIQHPLRGFSTEDSIWVIRHKTESDIYVGLTNLGKKRKEPIITDFITVKGLANAYRVTGGRSGSGELRQLMESFAEQKFFHRVNYEDFQIEKITTQIYGS